MDNRLEKLKWNSTLALCYQIVLIVTGLILPRCFLYYYGSEVNGLISSITQFLAFINICDLGISAVVSAAYYKALADGNTHRISQIFVYSKRFFNVIGIILITYIIILLGVYPTIINDTFDFGFTFTLIVAMSLSQFGQYFIGLSYQLLLDSDQKSYVQLIINGSTLVLNVTISILLMVAGASIQLVKLSTSLIYLLRPLAMSLYVKKRYAINRNVSIDKTVISQKRNGIVQHISYMLYENTDVMVLTFFSTLKNVSIYSVYTLVTNSIKQIITAATTGVQSLLGNMIARSETDKLKFFYSLYNWGVHTVSTILFTITGLLIVPFVQIYTAGIIDTDYNVPVFAILITIACFFSCIRNCQYVLIRSAGHFKQTQTASLIEAILNLSISIVLAHQFGLVGVAIGTVIATVFFVVYEMIYFSKNVVFMQMKYYLKQFLVDLIIVGISVLVSLQIDVFTGSIVWWVLQAVISASICLAISLLMQTVFYKENIKLTLSKLLARFKRIRT